MFHWKTKEMDIICKLYKGDHVKTMHTLIQMLTYYAWYGADTLWKHASIVCPVCLLVTVCSHTQLLYFDLPTQREIVCCLSSAPSTCVQQGQFAPSPQCIRGPPNRAGLVQIRSSSSSLASLRGSFCCIFDSIQPAFLLCFFMLLTQTSDLSYACAVC